MTKKDLKKIESDIEDILVKSYTNAGNYFDSDKAAELLMELVKKLIILC